MSEPQQKTILVVEDDDDDVRESIVDVLQQTGRSVVEATMACRRWSGWRDCPVPVSSCWI